MALNSAVKTRPTYSFVIPVHNEQDALPEFRRRVDPVLARLDGESEVIVVDDGSTDMSWDVMTAFRSVDRRYKAVRLSRNFGHQAAISAGMDLAAGDAVVIMDADLQDPPEVVLEMAGRWRDGYEVVYGVREDRAVDSVFKRTTADLFYRLLSTLTEVDIPNNVGDFRLIDRRAVEAFRSMREGGRFVRGMYAWVGFRQVGVPYVRQARCAGSTKYPLRKMMRLAGDAVTGFSRKPLKLALKVGAAFSLLAILGGLASVAVRLSGAYTVPGWASILVAVCLLGGLQLAFLGVIGLYVGRTFDESLRRPLYIVSQLVGVPVPIEPIPRAVIAPPTTVEGVLGEALLPAAPDGLGGMERPGDISVHGVARPA
jgi:glycosyltransferase involved in cell wall biosynthesis